MKTYVITVLSVLVTLTLLMDASAGITGGDVIVIDFGLNATPTTGNWNNLDNGDADGQGDFSTPYTFGSVDLIRFSDGVATGVGLVAEKAAGGGFAGIGGATVTSVGNNASFTKSGTIPDSAQADISFWGASDWTLTFTGLTNTLTYNIEIMSLRGTGNASDITVAAQTQLVHPNDSTYVYAFKKLSTDESGNIEMSFAATNYSFINAIELTVYRPAGTVIGIK